MSAVVCIDPRTLKHRLDEVVVIDVRTPGEFEAIHLPSAKNRPLDQLDGHRDEIRALLDEGREVVLVCRSGARAHQAQEQLAAVGLPELPILEGGVLAWEAADGPVVQDVIRWDLERQVRFVAGAVGAGLVIASLTNTCAMGMLLTRLPYNRPRSAATA